jgi:GNAT superfamily N-acetyltransferase
MRQVKVFAMNPVTELLPFRTMWTLSALNSFTASRYTSLTFPAYRSTLAWFDGAQGMRGVAASSEGEPIGLALGRHVTAGLARILSLYVVPAFRNRGIGSQLLSQFEAEMAAEGDDRVEIRYALDTDGTSALERMLRRCNWPAEGDRVHVFELDGQIMSAPWFRSAVLPPPYAIASWTTLSGEERRVLADALERDAWCPELLVPFRFEAKLEPLNSLVLRHGGAVVGWLLTEPLDATAIHYANLYVRPSLNRAGDTFASLALLAEGVRRQERAMGVTSRGRFEITPDNAAMLRFIDRRLRRFLVSRMRLQRLVKRFPTQRAGLSPAGRLNDS